LVETSVHGLAHAVNGLVDHYGLAALFFLLLIEEVGVWLPLPGDLLIFYFGYKVARSPHPLLGAIPVLLTVAVAAVSGSTALYLIIRRFRWLLHRFGPVIHLNESRLKRLEGWLQRFGFVAIIVGRLLPGLRIATTVVASTFGIPLYVFVPAVAISSLIWTSIYLVAGAAAGSLLELLPRALRVVVADWLYPVIAAVILLETLLHVLHPRRRPSLTSYPPGR
jgi:membrane protein DedA with SNARE-associated domain